MTRKDILSDLKARQRSADDRRIPGGARKDPGVWYDGFYWGLQIAIEGLERKDR